MLAQGKIKVEEANRARRSPIVVSRKICEEQKQYFPFYSYVFQELETSWENNWLVKVTLSSNSAGSTDASAGRSTLRLCQQCWVKIVAFPKVQLLP